MRPSLAGRARFLTHTGPGPGVRDGLERANRVRVHALAFDTSGKTLEAVKRLQAEGIEVHDVHTPFPIHGMDEALGLPPSRLGWATFAGGLAGAVVASSLQVWTHAIDWPLVIGGKSPLAVPAQIPISFELTVLFAAFATVGTLLWRRRLFPRVDSRPPTQPHALCTDDHFVVLVVERDAGYDPARFAALCRELSPVEVSEGWRVV